MPRASQAPGVAEPRKAAPGILPSSRLAVTVAVAGGVAAAAVLAACGVMWLHYGPTVFFQTLAAGLAACF